MIHSSLEHWGIELLCGLKEFGFQVKKKPIEAQAKIRNKSEFIWVVSSPVFTLFLWLGWVVLCLAFFFGPFGAFFTLKHLQFFGGSSSGRIP